MKKIISGILAASLMAAPLAVSADSAILCGDANCDGIVDVRDLTAVVRHMVKLNELSAEEFTNADVDNDNEISLKDIQQLKMYLIRKIDSFQQNDNNFYTFSSYKKYDSVPVGTKFVTAYKDLQRISVSDSIKDSMLAEYNESFFEDYVLYVTSVSESTSSGKYSLNHVDADENEITLYIDLVLNGSSTDVMCKRVICFGIPKNIYNNQKINIADTKSLYIVEKADNFDPGNITFLEGEYTEKDFKNIYNADAVNPYVCQGKNISSVSEFKAILNDENSELLEKYNDEFFSSNQLIVIQYAEGFTNVTYSEIPQTYDNQYPEKRNIHITRQLSSDSVFSPHVKYLVYSTWLKSDADSANIIFE